MHVPLNPILLFIITEVIVKHITSFRKAAKSVHVPLGASAEIMKSRGHKRELSLL